ncbi:Transposable element tcb2 transposase, partial [Caligus rogercresseyi]
RTVIDITKKWEESGMSKRKEHKPRSDRICTPTLVAGLKRSIKANPGRPMSILTRKRGVHLSSSPDGTLWPPGPCTHSSRTRRPPTRPNLCSPWLKKNMPNFGDFNTWPPNSPDLNPCDYYYL